jgi:hypothetical protein
VSDAAGTDLLSTFSSSLLHNPTFRQANCSACQLLHAGFFLGLFFETEDGDSISHKSWLSTDYNVLHPRKYKSLLFQIA